MTEIRVSAVQYSYKTIKNFKDFEENVEILIEKAEGSDFIIFPEAFTLEFQYLIPKYDISRLHEFTVDYINLFTKLSEEYNQVIFAGSHIILDNNNNRYNSGFIFSPDGKILQHHKTHIMPYERQMGITPGDILEVFEINNTNSLPIHSIDEIYSLNAENQQKINNALMNVTICDPACGSGRFLLSSVEIIFHILETLNPKKSKSELKLTLIRNLHGYDISKSAISLTKAK